MDGERIARAAARIEAAARRIDAAASRPGADRDQPELAQKYQMLRTEAEAALAELDQVIGALGQ